MAVQIWVYDNPSSTQQLKTKTNQQANHHQFAHCVGHVQGDLEFNVEVSIMAGLQHANLVPLLGSCCEADQRVAVFEFMPHGNLRDMLDGKTPAACHFNWPARLNIALGVAKGLAYLHEVYCCQPA